MLIEASVALLLCGVAYVWHRQTCNRSPNCPNADTIPLISSAFLVLRNEHRMLDEVNCTETQDQLAGVVIYESISVRGFIQLFAEKYYSLPPNSAKSAL